MKQITLTILSEPTVFKCNVSADDKHNVWVAIEYNNVVLTLPLAAFNMAENAVYDFLGEDEGYEN